MRGVAIPAATARPLVSEVRWCRGIALLDAVPNGALSHEPCASARLETAGEDSPKPAASSQCLGCSRSRAKVLRKSLSELHWAAKENPVKVWARLALLSHSAEASADSVTQRLREQAILLPPPHQPRALELVIPVALCALLSQAVLGLPPWM